VTGSASVKCHRLLLFNLLAQPSEQCGICSDDTSRLSVGNFIVIDSGSDVCFDDM
jgi:hypothetical protein